jgi:hypothetical protein
MMSKNRWDKHVDQEHMARLGEVMEVRVPRDAVIKGRIDKAKYVENTIHFDGRYIVMASFETVRQWSAAKRALGSFCQLRQDGDMEGVLFMPVLPTLAQAKTLRRLLGIRKKRVDRPETVERLIKVTASTRFSAVGTDVIRGFGALQRCKLTKGIRSTLTKHSTQNPAELNRPSLHANVDT